MLFFLAWYAEIMEITPNSKAHLAEDWQKVIADPAAVLTPLIDIGPEPW